jgi:hypothetical protein
MSDLKIMFPEELEIATAPKILLDSLTREVLQNAGCGKKTTIATALTNLRCVIPKLINERQRLWKSGGVGLWKKRGDSERGGCENEEKWQHIFNMRIHADNVIWVLESLPDHSRNLNRVLEEIASELEKKHEPSSESSNADQVSSQKQDS